MTLLAFQQYSKNYDDWPTLADHLAIVSTDKETANIIVAESSHGICGAVGYIPPGNAQIDNISDDWAYIRLLVVNPNFRGKGVAKALTEECIDRASTDLAQAIALHTSPIMEVALGMYERMGFRFIHSGPKIHNVEYAIYKMELG